MDSVKIVPKNSNKIYYNLNKDSKKKDRKKAKVKAEKISNKLSKKEAKLFKKLTKEMKNDPQVRKCKGFHLEELTNIAIVDESTNTFYPIKGKISKKKLAKLGSKLENAYVLINFGHGYFKKLPFSVYKKLCKIRYMVITLKIDITEDGWDESFRVIDQTFRISSINRLFNYLALHDGRTEGIRMFYERDGWYTVVDVIEKVHILFKNSVKKMDMRKFLHKYNL